jgi:hypothetical protein
MVQLKFGVTLRSSPMKTITSIALASVLVAATASGASAGGWDGPGGWKHRGGHRPHPQYNDYHQAPDAGGAIVAGAILGLTFGLLANQAFAEPEPYYYQPEPIYEPEPFQHADAGAYLDHVEWCRANYRSYNEETDTFRDFQGVIRRCVAPY